MRNRDLVIKRIEQIESKLETLRFLVSRGGDAQNFYNEIEKTKDVLSELKSMIEREPFAPEEINRV